MNLNLYLIIFLFFFPFNYAFSNDLFETEIFDIKFKSSNIEETKKNKIDEIKNKSFKKILENLLINKDYNKIIKKSDKSFVLKTLCMSYTAS